MVQEPSDALTLAIGARVRQERQSRQWTLDQLAEQAGVSRRMVINVEQAEANPSIATLLRLSEALGVGLPALVAPPEPAAVHVTRCGNGAVLWTSDNGGRAVLVAGSTPPDVMELWDWTLGPGDHHRSEAHKPGTRELIHVLKGSLTVTVGGQQTDLATGDAVAFPGDSEHSYSNSHRRPARFSLAVFEPANPRPLEVRP